MNAEIIEFPEQPKMLSQQPFIGMTMTKVVNGKTVIMNIAKMTKEEFVTALLNDAKMREKQELALKYINS